MESIKEVSKDKVIYWLYGTEKEIQDYFRKEPIIPAKEIHIHCFQRKLEWEKFKTILRIHEKGHKKL